MKTVSRTLGSDLNGFIKDDNYVPFIHNKFYSLSKLFVLANFQKKMLLKRKLIKKNRISINPLGTYKIKLNKKKLEFNKINFLTCNNLIELKNNFYMIEFIKIFSRFSKKKINYYIVGDGYEKDKIKSKLNKYKTNFNFKLIKKVDNLPKFLINNNIHFFMNFSSQEGMSFSIMEALSCGIPVISSSIEANKNLVNKSRGYLLNLKDLNKSFKKITDQIIYDIKFKKEYFKKKRNAKNFIDKNLINKICYSDFYNQLKKL